MALNTCEMRSNSIKIAFFSKKLQKLIQRLGALPQARCHGDIPEPWPRNHCLRPSKRVLWSPKQRLCLKECNRLGATGVQFEAWDPQTSGYQPRIREQELFFRWFCYKDLFSCCFTPKFAEIRAVFEKNTFFFFWSSPQASWKFAQCWRWRLFLVFTPDFWDEDFFFWSLSQKSWK